MNQPLVSISCITYNHSKFIRQCLDGFLMQRCDFEYEILIHDDASDDGTQDIIKEYYLKYPELIKPIFQSKNQYSQGIRGLNAKFNFSRAKGKYIALCEGDDFWIDPLKLHKQVMFLESNLNFNVCAHNSFLKDEITFKMQEWRWDIERNIFDVEDYIFKIFFHTSSVVFRNSLILPSYLSDTRVLQGDIALFLIAIGEGKVYFIEDFMSVYRSHHGGITKSETHLDKLKSYESLLYIYRNFSNEFDFISNNRILKLKINATISLVSYYKSNSELKYYNKLCYYFYIILLKILIHLKRN